MTVEEAVKKLDFIIGGYQNIVGGINMSYYYCYYLGYEKDGKVYPWGPYTYDGKLKPVVCKSRSFASDLYKRFHCIFEDQISDELRKEFECKDWEGNLSVDVKILPIGELPDKSYIKTGYFLINDVEAYEKSDRDAEGLFYDYLTPQVYAVKLEHQLRFGPNLNSKKDEFGDEYIEHNASDYMYYAYPDDSTEEWESFMIRSAVSMLEPFDLPEGVKIVILETEG